jgi:hypothetical protein
MTKLNDLTSPLAFLKTRKSGSVKALGTPGPSSGQVSEILDIAVRVPDHGKLNPWRFILFEGQARADIGNAFAERWKALHPEHGEESFGFQRGLFTRAPVVIVVVSTASPHARIPEWEQLMSSAYDPEAMAAMGLRGTERVAGIICIGTATVPLEDRPRPDPKTLLTRWVKA